MDRVAVTMALARGFHLAAALSLLGSIGFILWTLPAAAAVPAPLLRRLNRVCRVSGVLAILAGVVWFILQAGAIAGADTAPDLADALPVVAFQTRYGNVMVGRLGLIVAATAWAWRPSRRRIRLYPCAAAAAAALCLQGLIGHAGAAGGTTGQELVTYESLHLLAAGFWLGALVPLAISVMELAPADTIQVCERFTPIGLGCVLVLAGTGFVQGAELIGGLPALLGTQYGQFAVVKITLFLGALGLAALNRLWLTDRMSGGAAARRQLLASVSCETVAGLLIITAAAFMASSPPAAHSIPVWPLTWRFSLAAVREEPDFMREVVISLLLIGGTIAVLISTLIWGRFRLGALAWLAVMIVWRGPSLTLLTAEAYPTSFQTSPTEFSAMSIVRGRDLYGPNCASCHGAGGRGNGPAAAALRIKPADLTMPHLWEHADGDLFWWLSHGMDDPEGGLAMPGFAGSLSPDDLWALIDYIRAMNVSVALRQNPATAPAAIRAPAFPVACNGMGAASTDDLRGRPVLAAGGDPADEAELSRQAGTAAVTLALDNNVRPARWSCAAATPDAAGAYAVLAGVPPDALAGTDFLIDPNGWLRAINRPGPAGAWDTRQELLAVIRDINSRPVGPSPGGAHEHHH